MQQITIESYHPWDENKLSIIILRCLREINSKDMSTMELENLIAFFSPECIKKYSEDINSPILVAKLDDTIVGTVTITDNRVRSFFVDPDMHGNGIGKLLISHGEDIMKKNGFTFSYVGSSVFAVPFYQKQWYIIIWEMIDPNVGRLIKMQKQF
jgi:GNAT superfamily N-acetyltransferase